MTKRKDDDLEKITFEEAYKKLDQASREIISDDIPLERAVECYREGRRYYDICKKKLENAGQLIQIYDRENDSVMEFNEDEQ